MSEYRAERNGWVLFEMMVALTIFVFTALAVLGAVNQGISAAEHTRDRTKAVDLARSTMAKLEAGLGTPQSLAGPVEPWESEPDPDAPFDEHADGGFSEVGPPPSLWEVEIDTVPSEFGDLTHVIVTVVKRLAKDSDLVTVSYQLHQLVRLAPEAEDTVGDLDDIAAEAIRGASGQRGGGGR